MYACVCKAVRVAEIHSARSQGMRSWEEVATVCGAGTECGACHDQIDELLRAECACSPQRPSQGPAQSAA
jgi:bacterioferritin-associated ferredoxin